MPEIELPPGKYRFRRPLSKPLAWFFVAVGAAMLVWIYTTHSGTITEWFLTIFLALGLGVLLGAIFQDID